MVSTWLRMRMHYLGNVRISRLATIFAIVVGVVLFFRWLLTPSRGVVRYKPAPVEHGMSAEEIDDYLSALEDTRPPHCRLDYGGQQRPSSRPRVSIVVDFHDAEFYGLKLTLESIVRHTPADLYEEIVLLDDGSDQAPIRQHADQFLRAERYSKVRAFRSETYHGRGATRFKASRVAEGDVLVFVGADVVVNVGWLEPLIGAVREDRRRLVVSHSDNLLSERRFYQVADDLVTTFSWTLSTVYAESADRSGTLLRTPIMRGDVVAVAKDFLEAVGNYDDAIYHGGGHDLELSLRTWLCGDGGQIVKSVCSRVATHGVLKPLTVSNEATYRRIVELWLDGYKDVAYRQGGVDGRQTDDERLDVDIRRTFLRKKLSCRSFDWYLANVATEVLAPPPEMVHYGKLRVSAAYCARVSKELGRDVSLALCRPYFYDPLMIFMLDDANRIRKGDLCFMATSATSRVVLTQCQADNKLQTWKFLDGGRVVSGAFDDACLTHVTILDDAKTRQHEIHVSECRSGEDAKQNWSFINF